MSRSATTPDDALARGIPVAEVSSGVEAWFRAEARDLPWRRARTPWRALVSELMLQQTQVSRVVERFDAFLDRFPTPAAMVEAGEDEVLAAWEGMGYYRRARLLHAAAVRIVERHGGEVPDDPVAILDLPGVGRYTAGAIASIVFGKREPIVDGNVVRVVARLAAIDARADDPSLVASTWRAAEELVSAAGDPGVLNEGLMELGATVCTPANPRCDRCPVASSCRGRTRGVESEVPRPKSRPVRTVVHIHLVIMRRGDEVLLERRPRGGVWGGLWQPIEVESEIELEPDVIAARLEARLGAPIRLDRLARVRRLLTHREVHLHLFEAGQPGGDPRGEFERETDWFDRDRASELGCPKPVRTLLDRFGWPEDRGEPFLLG